MNTGRQERKRCCDCDYFEVVDEKHGLFGFCYANPPILIQSLIPGNFNSITSYEANSALRKAMSYPMTDFAYPACRFFIQKTE